MTPMNASLSRSRTIFTPRDGPSAPKRYITDDGQVAALAEATVEIHGRLDAVVYCGAPDGGVYDLEALVRFSGEEITRSSGGGKIVLISDAQDILDLSLEHAFDNRVSIHAMSPNTFRILDAVSDLIRA